MKLFSFVAFCFFGLLAVVSADPDEPGSFYIGECIGCNTKIHNISAPSAKPGTQQVDNPGHFYIGKCIDCKEDPVVQNYGAGAAGNSRGKINAGNGASFSRGAAPNSVILFICYGIYSYFKSYYA